MSDKRVRDWMTPNPVTVLPSTPSTEAFELMRERHIRRLPVVENGKLIGIVALSDLLKAGAYTDDTEASKMRIYLVMTTAVRTVTPETTLRQAAKLMLTHKISGLPVLDGETLAGIITESDIFRAFMADELVLAGLATEKEVGPESQSMKKLPS